MPPVRAITATAAALTIVDHRGTKTLLKGNIPGNPTVAEAEAWVNGTWIPANIFDYQARVHIYSLEPLRWTAWTGDIGEPLPPAGWWGP